MKEFAVILLALCGIIIAIAAALGFIALYPIGILYFMDFPITLHNIVYLGVSLMFVPMFLNIILKGFQFLFFIIGEIYK